MLWRATLDRNHDQQLLLLHMKLAQTRLSVLPNLILVHIRNATPSNLHWLWDMGKGTSHSSALIIDGVDISAQLSSTQQHMPFEL